MKINLIRSVFFSLIVLGIVTGCSFSKENQNTVESDPVKETLYGESLSFSLDGRSWELGYQSRRDNEILLEYTLPGETVNTWKELVTEQAFPSLLQQISSKEFMETMKDTLLATCPESSWTILEENDSGILYEWYVKNCAGNDDQFEIARILSDEESIYILHYAVKTESPEKVKKEEWKQILLAATIRKRAKE